MARRAVVAGRQTTVVVTVAAGGRGDGSIGGGSALPSEGF